MEIYQKGIKLPFLALTFSYSAILEASKIFFGGDKRFFNPFLKVDTLFPICSLMVGR